MLYSFFFNFNKNFLILKYNLLFFYNFLYKYIYTLYSINTYKAQISLENLILVNFKHKQPKLNLLDLNIHKNFVFTIGLILKILNLYKKSNRKNIMFLKYLINYVVKKYSNTLVKKNIIFVIKGLRKNFLKLIYFFKLFIINFDINVFYINPIKIFKDLKLKKKRSIKRRLFKKLVDFNKI